MRWRPRLVAAVALAAAALSIWQLERGRAGVTVTPLAVGTTPAAVYRLPEAAPAPVAIIDHGFAGSGRLMESFALTLARAGFVAVTYDALGHGRNPVPMSGDVTVITGTTQLLMDELARVTDAALALPGTDGRAALIGHSMASDIVVRQALRDPRIGAVVAVSMYSEAVGPAAPRDLLVIAGGFEGRLTDEALRALQAADPAARLGTTVGDPADGTGRRAVTAPGVGHVGVLFSATTMRETRDWLNAAFGRGDTPPVARRGGWIALLIAAVVALGWPMARALRDWRAPDPPQRLATGTFLTAVLLPALAVPLALAPFDTGFLPVLVADYLTLHLAGYGLLSLALLGWRGALPRRAVWPVPLLTLLVAAYGIGLFGGPVDRYLTTFVPSAERLAIILAMLVGTVPFMAADALLTEGGRAPVWRVLTARGVALASLGLAVVLDPEGLFFLVLILPLILLFFLSFGTVAGWVGRATWRPMAGGIGMGAVLAWALGVTFPTFAG